MNREMEQYGAAMTRTARTVRERKVTTRVQAVRWAIRYGLIPEDENYEACIDAWVAGFHAARRSKKGRGE